MNMIHQACAEWSQHDGNNTFVAVVTRINKVTFGDGIPTITSGTVNMAGGTTINALFSPDLMFHMNDADVQMNTQVLGDTNQFYSALLHEIGHVKGLYHNSISGSIMNISIVVEVVPNTNPVQYKAAQNIPRASLHVADLYGIFMARHAETYHKLTEQHVEADHYLP
jgi:hypothetical protein